MDRKARENIEEDLRSLYKAFDNNRFFDELKRIVGMDPQKIRIADAYTDEDPKQKRAIATIRILAKYDEHALLLYSFSMSPLVARYLYRFTSVKDVVELVRLNNAIINALSRFGKDENLVELLRRNLWITYDVFKKHGPQEREKYFISIGHKLLDVGYGELFSRTLLLSLDDSELLRRALQTERADVIESFMDVYSRSRFEEEIPPMINKIKRGHFNRRAYDYATDYGIWRANPIEHPNKAPKPNPSHYGL